MAKTEFKVTIKTDDASPKTNILRQTVLAALEKDSALKGRVSVTKPQQRG